MKTATDDELVELANEPQGGGAVVEAMRRLREAVDNAKVSADRYSRIMLVLTCVLIILTIVLAIPVVKEVWHWSQ
jgi:hypothetical protein